MPRSPDIDRQILLKLLEVKDVDVRIMTLKQAGSAADHAVHIGGAFSATVPLVTLYYGGIMRYDVARPTRGGQDLFVLSKGHAVAAMASIYADLGYFDRSVLENSRSMDSILNGHPGPLLPGVHTATGPMGQGIAVAEGLAFAGRIEERFDVFAITGDGELQEGTPWEAIMLAGDRRLSNLCVIVDNNHGQLDDVTRLSIDMAALPEQFRSFGWRTIVADGTSYASMYDALAEFKFGSRPAGPTAIISRTTKGAGGHSVVMKSHKTVLTELQIDRELRQQERARENRLKELRALAVEHSCPETVGEIAARMNLHAEVSEDAISVDPVVVPPRTLPSGTRDKRIRAAAPSPLDPKREYSSAEIMSMAMELYGQDPRVVTVDADLSSTSGLAGGLEKIDTRRSYNVGVAEANMMCIGEAFAILGYNAWVSTFSPFFNWNVLRRIAVGQQERMEVMATKGGWLEDGHGLDLTFLATAPNLETRTNGATHMGNDDLLVYRGIAHLSFIDVSCPNLLLGVTRWIMEGNRGLCYVRVMRSASPVIYPEIVDFSPGRALYPRRSEHPAAAIVSSGRGVHEALEAASILQREGIEIDVIDMPSIDRAALIELCGAARPLLIAEQNNGYIYSELGKALLSQRAPSPKAAVHPVNTSSPDGEPQFVHSGTYEELLDRHGLSPAQLADAVKERL